MEISELSDIDIFFYYDDGDPSVEIASDLMSGLLQSKRTMFYNRNEGCGISEKENYPNSINNAIAMKYDIVSWVSKRNTEVSDGTSNTIDKRIAVSQNSINVSRESNGGLNIEILYIPFYDLTRPQNMTIPVRGI